MGYQSNVEMAICDTDMAGLLAAFYLKHPEYAGMITGELCQATIDGNTLTFSAQWWKWYSRRLHLGGEFVEVEAIEALMEFAKNWVLRDGTIDKGCGGCFERQGGDDDDYEYITWGDLMP